MAWASVRARASLPKALSARTYITVVVAKPRMSATVTARTAAESRALRRANFLKR